MRTVHRHMRMFSRDLFPTDTPVPRAVEDEQISWRVAWPAHTGRWQLDDPLPAAYIREEIAI